MEVQLQNAPVACTILPKLASISQKTAGQSAKNDDQQQFVAFTTANLATDLRRKRHFQGRNLSFGIAARGNGMPLLPIPVINTQLGIYHRHPVMLSLEQEP